MTRSMTPMPSGPRSVKSPRNQSRALPAAQWPSASMRPCSREGGDEFVEIAVDVADDVERAEAVGRGRLVGRDLHLDGVAGSAGADHREVALRWGCSPSGGSRSLAGPRCRGRGGLPTAVGLSVTARAPAHTAARGNRAMSPSAPRVLDRPPESSTPPPPSRRRSPLGPAWSGWSAVSCAHHRNAAPRCVTHQGW